MIVECLPNTVDGIRKLALIAFYEHPYPRPFIDELELSMLRAMRIYPDNHMPTQAQERRGKVVPIGLRYTKRGLLVEWRIGGIDQCDACMGRGTLRARGMNGEDYRVECPECGGSGEVDGDEEFVVTDLDGHELRKAA